LCLLGAAFLDGDFAQAVAHQGRQRDVEGDAVVARGEKGNDRVSVPLSSPGSSPPADRIPSTGQTARNLVRESPWQKENAKGTHVPATRAGNSTAGLSNHGYL
jgi:hypothetical protein